jgi:hypothetical protein
MILSGLPSDTGNAVKQADRLINRMNCVRCTQQHRNHDHENGRSLGDGLRNRGRNPEQRCSNRIHDQQLKLTQMESSLGKQEANEA